MPPPRAGVLRLRERGRVVRQLPRIRRRLRSALLLALGGRSWRGCRRRRGGRRAHKRRRRSARRRSDGRLRSRLGARRGEARDRARSGRLRSSSGRRGARRAGTRRRRGSARRGGRTLRLDLAPARDIALVLLDRLGEDMAARAVGDEIQFPGARRAGDGFHRGSARIGDRARRKTIDRVGVVGRRLGDLVLGEAVPQGTLAADQAVDDGRVGLQAHA